MEFKILKLEVTNKIALITISRPQALNALNSDFFAEMDEMLNQISADKEVRAIIITGEGKAFVAGADIAEMSNMDSEQGKAFSKKGQDVFERFGNMDIPVIAAVNGFALGGGCELAMSCDIRIASTFAKFGQPEVNLGLIPGYAGTQRLSRLVGLSNALYLLMTADIINAEEAFRLGLVQKVVESDKLIEEAINVANKIGAKGKIAIKMVKEVAIKGSMLNFNLACELESKEFGNLFGNGESGEGMNAFLEKRKPNW